MGVFYLALFTLNKSKQRLRASNVIRILKKMVMVVTYLLHNIPTLKNPTYCLKYFFNYFLEPFTLHNNNSALTIKRNESTPKKVFI